MSNHTPAPWEAFVNNRQGYALGIRAAGGQLPGGYEIIAEIIDGNGTNHFPDGVPEAEADARLMAAAPELLAALKLFCCAVPSGGYFAAADPKGIGPNVGKSCDEAKARARAAIAKAEGRTT